MLKGIKNINIFLLIFSFNRATAVASSTVKSHVVSVLQDFVIHSYNPYEQDGDIQHRDHNHQIIMETTQTMVNIQHQFCVASYESFSTLMCCFICQAPVGFPHDTECAFQKRHAYVNDFSIDHQFTEFRNILYELYVFFRMTNSRSTSSDLRSQTPSPHFGQLTMGVPKNEHRTISLVYESDGKICWFINIFSCIIFLNAARVPSPHQDIRGPSPIQNFLENIRGPLPNPGHLLGMKAPFYRCSRSPLNFPLFPLQRRWSEAAAGEVRGTCQFQACFFVVVRWYFQNLQFIRWCSKERAARQMPRTCGVGRCHGSLSRIGTQSLGIRLALHPKYQQLQWMSLNRLYRGMIEVNQQHLVRYYMLSNLELRHVCEDGDEILFLLC